VAKTKSDLHKDAVSAGKVAADSDPDDYTAEQLQGILSGNIPVHERQSAVEPIVAPDGHVTLSQEDIDARDS